VGFHQLSKLLLRIVEHAKDLIISDDMIAADVVAMKRVKGYDDCFAPDNEAINRRKHEQGEEPGLGTGDCLRGRTYK